MESISLIDPLGDWFAAVEELLIPWMIAGQPQGRQQSHRTTNPTPASKNMGIKYTGHPDH